jgi:hypothetical protein
MGVLFWEVWNRLIDAGRWRGSFGEGDWWAEGCKCLDLGVAVVSLKPRMAGKTAPTRAGLRS